MDKKELIQFIDYTSLNATDTKSGIQALVETACGKSIDGLKVAGVCCFLNFSDQLVETLKSESIASVVVAGGFPHGQIPLESKVEEVKYAAGLGVDEIDIVLSRNLLLSGEHEKVAEEIKAMKKCCGSSLLKVILETGEIDDYELIAKASEIAIGSGANFIKTSTGKSAEGATIPKFEIMLGVIANHWKSSGQKVGIKASGGIRKPDEALDYVDAVQRKLGKEWLTPALFRIGASSLLKNID